MYNPVLDTFITVADEGSFTKAAEKLFISHTAVIKQINQLENRLALTLFLRNKQGIQLTRTGELFYREAKQLIKQADKSLEKIRASQETQTRTFKFGSSALFPYGEFMPTWQAVRTKMTGYDLKIIPFNDGEKFLNLLKKDIDLMVGAFDLPNHMDDLVFYELGQHYFTLALPLQHSLSSKAEISFEELEGSQLMIMEAGISQMNDSIRRHLNRHYPYIELISIPPYYNLDTFNQVVERQIPLLSHSNFNSVHPSLVNIPLREGFTIPYGLVYRKDNSRASDFVKQLDDVR